MLALLFCCTRNLCTVTSIGPASLRLHSLAEAPFPSKEQVCHGYGLVIETCCILCLGITLHRLDEETSKPKTRMCHTYNFSWSCGHSQVDRRRCLWDDEDDDEPPPESKSFSRRLLESSILCSCLLRTVTCFFRFGYLLRSLCSEGF